MKFLLLMLVVIIGGCTATEKYGSKSNVAYAGYNYRDVYTYPEVKSFGQDFNVLRNVRFCFEKTSVCKNVFPNNKQHLPNTTYIDKKNEKGIRKRVFLFRVHQQDTDADGNITKNDLATIYAYEPSIDRLIVLERDVVFLDMESVVNTFTFFIRYNKKGKGFITQYELSTLEPRKTVELET